MQKNLTDKEEKMLQSYNEQFYSSLKSLKLISQNLTPDQKALYHFEQNINAAVSSTTGQLMSTYEELIAKNEYLKKIIISLSNEIKELEIQCDQVNDNLIDEFRPQIELLNDALTKYIEKQRFENYKLMEEINLLEKEKAELQQSVYNALGYLNKLEKEVGLKAKTYTYIYDQTIGNSELGSKFIIETENV